MKRMFLCTCGISLLTNGLNEDDKSWYYKLSNKKEVDLSIEQKNQIDREYENKKQKLETAQLSVIRKMSAELNGLIGYYENNLSNGKDDMYYFLYTDTYQGIKVGQLLAEWTRSQGINAAAIHIRSMNTSSKHGFIEGVDNLIEFCTNTIELNRNYQVVFNLIGGFKSLQGYMLTLGMIFADEAFYIFEGSSEILTIPLLPTDVLDATQEYMEKHFELFRNIDVLGSVKESKVNGIKKTLIANVDGDVIMSKFAELYWKVVKAQYYKKSLISSPTNKIKFSDEFIKQCLRHPRIQDINQSIEDFWRFLDTGKVLKRSTFKSLTATDYSHELYLWSDKGAWRAYINEVDGVYIIKKIAKHL